MKPPTPAVFLDRDGVINASVARGCVTSWAEFRFLPGILDAIRALHEAGFRLVIVSNQSGVGHGLYSREALQEITARMLLSIRDAGGQIAGVYYCPHRDQDACSCRKPQRGLIDQACRQSPIDLPRSYVVGDDPKDVALGRAVGCRTVLVLSGNTPPKAAPGLSQPPDHVCRDLCEAAQWILAQPQPVL